MGPVTAESSPESFQQEALRSCGGAVHLSRGLDILKINKNPTNL